MRNKALKYFLAAAMMVILGAAPMAWAQDAANGTLTFSGRSVAAGVGYTWGQGVLTYNNQEYPFTVEGLSAVDVGIASVEGAGEVYNLKSPAAFSGNYVSAGTGVTLAGGGSVAALAHQGRARDGENPAGE